MVTPYYSDDFVTIYHGDCVGSVWPQIKADMLAEFLVTDPPYGIAWKKGHNRAAGSRPHAGIANDQDTSIRDEILARWYGRPAVVFGSLTAPRPANCTQTLIWQKPNDAGVVGSVTGFRRDIEAVFLCGQFPKRNAQWSSVVRSTIPNIGSPSSPAGRWGHPHAKPVDLMSQLIALAPGVVLDPFMGSGSTLVAAKLLGRQAIGIELEERFCEMAASRCAQEVLDLEAADPSDVRALQRILDIPEKAA